MSLTHNFGNYFTPNPELRTRNSRPWMWFEFEVKVLGQGSKFWIQKLPKWCVNGTEKIVEMSLNNWKGAMDDVVEMIYKIISPKIYISK